MAKPISAGISVKFRGVWQMLAVGSLPARGASRKAGMSLAQGTVFCSLAPEITMSKSDGGGVDFLSAHFSKVEQNCAFLPIYSYLTPVLVVYNTSL